MKRHSATRNVILSISRWSIKSTECLLIVILNSISSATQSISYGIQNTKFEMFITGLKTLVIKFIHCFDFGKLADQIKKKHSTKLSINYNHRTTFLPAQKFCFFKLSLP